jgi:hypothetical protein
MAKKSPNPKTAETLKQFCHSAVAAKVAGQSDFAAKVASHFNEMIVAATNS